MPLCLADVDAGAREHQAVGRELRVGRPDLLAVEDEGAVVLHHRAHLHGGQVGPAAGSLEHRAPDLIAVEHRAEVPRLCSSLPWAMRHGPSTPDADDVEDPRRPARPSSWLTMTCSIGPRPRPPNSWGQVTPASSPSASLPCHARRAAKYPASSAPARGAHVGRFGAVGLKPAADLLAVRGLLGRVVEIHARLLAWLTSQSVERQL